MFGLRAHKSLSGNEHREASTMQSNERENGARAYIYHHHQVTSKDSEDIKRPRELAGLGCHEKKRHDEQQRSNNVL